MIVWVLKQSLTVLSPPRLFKGETTVTPDVDRPDNDILVLNEETQTEEPCSAYEVFSNPRQLAERLELLKNQLSLLQRTLL